MKIYVVTKGSYSDFHIERIFLEEEKANSFSTLIDGYVREYETDDDKQFKYYEIIQCHYSDKNKFFYDFECVINDGNTVNETYFYTIGDYWFDLCLQRVVPEDIDEDELINKCKKTCYDIIAEMKYHKEIDGWSNEMIKEWVKSI